jgi:hypothetical protein
LYTIFIPRDGNGRIARLLTDLLLARAGYPPAAQRARRAQTEYHSLLADYMAAREPEALQPPDERQVGPFVRLIAKAVREELDGRWQE